MNKLMVLLMLTLTVMVGTANARSGGSSGGGFRSTSPSRSSGISLSKPAPAPKSPGIVLTKPTTPPPATTAAPKSPGVVLTKPTTPQPVFAQRTPKTPGIVLTKPTTPPVQSLPNRTNTVTVVHEHHYFGGGYGYGHGYYGGYSGGFGSSPFFWLWLMDRPQPQTVIVNGQPQPSTYTPPSTGQTVVNVLFGILMLTGIVALVIWIVRKVFV